MGSTTYFYMATYDVVPGPQYDIVLLRLQLTSVHAKLQTVWHLLW